MSAADSKPPIKEQLKVLERVQEFDLQIRALNRKKSDIPQVLRPLNQKIHSFQQKILAHQEKKAEFDKVLRQTDAAIELNNDRTQRTNAKLENVGNSKEFQAATKEMDQLKKLAEELGAQKEETAKQMAQIDETLKALVEEQSKIQSEKDEKSKEVHSELEVVDGKLSELTAERDQVAAGVDKPILSRYNRILHARDGLGMVPAADGRCKGCNMMIPPQTFNRLFRGEELENCPSCHRIIYIPESAEVPENQDVAAGQ